MDKDAVWSQLVDSRDECGHANQCNIDLLFLLSLFNLVQLQSWCLKAVLEKY